MNNKNYLKFEYVNSQGYKTVVEKEWDEPESGEFYELLMNVRYAILASGFSESMINDFIPEAIV